MGTVDFSGSADGNFVNKKKRSQICSYLFVVWFSEKKKKSFKWFYNWCKFFESLKSCKLQQHGSIPYWSQRPPSWGTHRLWHNQVAPPCSTHHPSKTSSSWVFCPRYSLFSVPKLHTVTQGHTKINKMCSIHEYIAYLNRYITTRKRKRGISFKWYRWHQRKGLLPRGVCA